MEALAARGNLAEALLVYDRLRVLLRDELGATPAPQITALNERLLTPGGAPATVRASAPGAAVPLPLVIERLEQRPFVGREPELEVLRERWAAPGASSSWPGSPASARRGWRPASPPPPTRAARPCCTAASTRRPSCPTSRSWRRCATTRRTPARRRPRPTSTRSPRSCPSSRGRGVPQRPAGERENRRYRLFEAVAALLGQAASARPLLLVVEDLQWAGRPTLLLLRHVVRRLHGAPLMVLVTLRDAEADPGGAPARLLADLSREEVVRRIALAGPRRAGDRRPGG